LRHRGVEDIRGVDSELITRAAGEGSGAIRASGMRLASYSLRSMAGLLKGLRHYLKEAKALLEELSS
jgi:hypothetical protein